MNRIPNPEKGKKWAKAIFYQSWRYKKKISPYIFLITTLLKEVVPKDEVC